MIIAVAKDGGAGLILRRLLPLLQSPVGRKGFGPRQDQQRQKSAGQARLSALDLVGLAEGDLGEDQVS